MRVARNLLARIRSLPFVKRWFPGWYQSWASWLLERGIRRAVDDWKSGVDRCNQLYFIKDTLYEDQTDAVRDEEDRLWARLMKIDEERYLRSRKLVYGIERRARNDT